MAWVGGGGRVGWEMGWRGRGETTVDWSGVRWGGGEVERTGRWGELEWGGGWKGIEGMELSADGALREARWLTGFSREASRLSRHDGASMFPS